MKLLAKVVDHEHSDGDTDMVELWETPAGLRIKEYLLKKAGNNGKGEKTCEQWYKVKSVSDSEGQLLEELSDFSKKSKSQKETD